MSGKHQCVGPEAGAHPDANEHGDLERASPRSDC